MKKFNMKKFIIKEFMYFVVNFSIAFILLGIINIFTKVDYVDYILGALVTGVIVVSDCILATINGDILYNERRK